MKKVIVTLALIASAISSSYAQGWVLFNNANNTRVSTNSIVGGASSGTMQGPNGVAISYYFALFSSTTSQLIGGVTNRIAGATGTYAFNDGNWYFNNPSFGPDYGTNNNLGTFTSIQSDPANSQGTEVTSGASQSFVVIGWSANIGSTLSALETWYANPTFNGWIGQSSTSVFMTPGSGGVSIPPGITGTSGGAIPGFMLGLVVPTPEPSTIALAGLGGLSLLLFRRRK